MPTLAPWLTQLTPLPEIASAGVGAGSRIAQTQLAREGIGREAAQFAQSQALARQQLQQQAALAAMENLGQQARFQLDVEELRSRQSEASDINALTREEAARKAQESALRFQGVQDFQRDLASGMNPRDAILKNLGKLSYTSPGIIGDLLSEISTAKDSSFLGRQVDLGMPGVKGFQTGQQQLQIVSDPSYVKPMSDLEKGRLRKIEAEIQKMNNLLPRLSDAEKIGLTGEVGAITKSLDALMGEDVSVRISEAVARYENRLTNPVTVSGTVTITTKDQYDKLPSGSTFAGTDGKMYVKP